MTAYTANHTLAILSFLTFLQVPSICAAEQTQNASPSAQKFLATMRTLQAKVPEEIEQPKKVQSQRRNRPTLGSSSRSRRSSQRVTQIGQTPTGVRKIGDPLPRSSSHSSARNRSQSYVCRACGGGGCPSCVANSVDITNPLAGGFGGPSSRRGAPVESRAPAISGRIADGRYWVTAMNVTSRPWTSLAGSVIDAELVKFAIDKVLIKVPDDRVITIHPLRLSDSDLDYMLELAAEQEGDIARRAAEIEVMQASQSKNGLHLAKWVWEQLRSTGSSYRSATLTARSIVSSPIVTSRGNVYVTDGNDVKWGTPDRTRVERFLFDVAYVTGGGLIREGQGVVDVGYSPMTSQATLLGVLAPGMDNYLDGGLVVSRGTIDEDIEKALNSVRSRR